MLIQLASNVWKINEDSNSYIIKLSTKNKKQSMRANGGIIVIDCCPKTYRKKFLQEFRQIADPDEVDVVLFTHLHYDHVGNFEVFKNAKFYASKEELMFFDKDSFGAVLNKDIAAKLKVIRENLLSLENIKKFLHDNAIEIYDAPGHTAGSVLYLYKTHSILFTGDTYFGDSCYGRTDLPSSLPDKMPQTLKMLKDIPHHILCGGHDYV